MNTQTANKWGLSAGLLMLLMGAFHMVEGLVALLSPARLFVRESGLLVIDIERWGVVLLIWGLVMIAGGGAYVLGARRARTAAFALAIVNGVGQLAWINQAPWLSGTMMLGSVVLIGALALSGAGEGNGRADNRGAGNGRAATSH